MFVSESQVRKVGNYNKTQGAFSDSIEGMCQRRSNVAWARPRLVRTRSRVARCRPNLARHRPHSAKHDRETAKLRPNSTNVFPDLEKIWSTRLVERRCVTGPQRCLPARGSARARLASTPAPGACSRLGVWGPHPIGASWPPMLGSPAGSTIGTDPRRKLKGVKHTLV